MLLAALTIALQVSGTDPDADRDGLSDFHEVHKYGTDPRKADSDGDGVADGDWLERREYAYAVRAVVQVMRPVTPEYMNDDFQDARVLDESEDHVELEVILYPFGTANEAIEADARWRKPAKELERWLEPGPTSDWTPAMRAALLEELGEVGVDVASLSDREVVARASAWLMERAEYHDGFSTFLTSFDERGRPYVEDGLRSAVEREAAQNGLSIEAQWERELSTRGMFEQRVRGSCTSSAIYLSGCLRAIGVPTRTVLCIPLVDANDERERALAERLRHHGVRRIVTTAAKGAIGKWTSHTFNEAWVGERWRRLNYSKLGQGILDEQFLGLMIHVGTFRDWADARAAETIGRRQGLEAYDDLFGGPNPYSTISLRDEFGAHCALENPELGIEKAVVSEIYWTDDPKLPPDVLEGCRESGRFGLIARVGDVPGEAWWREFLAGSDARVYLDAEGHARISTAVDAGCWWLKNGQAYVYLPFGAADRESLVEGVEYAVTARNEAAEYEWVLEAVVTRG
jgi:hypothetical protein